jgi:hypothetical protein
MTDLTVGSFYNVPCAEIVMDDGRSYFIPIFDHLHADQQFRFPDEHYHIDGRFYIHPRLQHQFSIQSGHTSTVIVPGKSESYKFVSITVKNLQCVRLKTGLIIPYHPTEKQKPNVTLYTTWYAGFIGKKCTGRRCPHLGTEMFEKNGMLVCPLHNLTANLNDLKVCSRK